MKRIKNPYFFIKKTGTIWKLISFPDDRMSDGVSSEKVLQAKLWFLIFFLSSLVLLNLGAAVRRFRTY